MNNLFKTMKEAAKQYKFEVEMMAGYEIVSENDTRPELVILLEAYALIAWWNVQKLFNKRVRCRNGHDFYELGGDPERQTYYGECSRCGKSIEGGWW